VNTTDHLDDLARKYNQTKDPRIKDLWYEELNKWANGSNNTRRRNVPARRSVKEDDGTYCVIRKPRLLRSV